MSTRTNGANLGFESKLWAAAAVDDGVPFEEKMAALTAELCAQFEQDKVLQTAIRRNLQVLGYGH